MNFLDNGEPKNSGQGQSRSGWNSAPGSPSKGRNARRNKRMASQALTSLPPPPPPPPDDEMLTLRSGVENDASAYRPLVKPVVKMPAFPTRDNSQDNLHSTEPVYATIRKHRKRATLGLQAGRIAACMVPSAEDKSPLSTDGQLSSSVFDGSSISGDFEIGDDASGFRTLPRNFDGDCHVNALGSQPFNVFENLPDHDYVNVVCSDDYDYACENEKTGSVEIQPKTIQIAKYSPVMNANHNNENERDLNTISRDQDKIITNNINQNLSDINTKISNVNNYDAITSSICRRNKSAKSTDIDSQKSGDEMMVKSDSEKQTRSSIGERGENEQKNSFYEKKPHVAANHFTLSKFDGHYDVSSSSESEYFTDQDTSMAPSPPQQTERVCKVNAKCKVFLLVIPSLIALVCVLFLVLSQIGFFPNTKGSIGVIVGMTETTNVYHVTSMVNPQGKTTKSSAENTGINKQTTTATKSPISRETTRRPSTASTQTMQTTAVPEVTTNAVETTTMDVTTILEVMTTTETSQDSTTTVSETTKVISTTAAITTAASTTKAKKRGGKDRSRKRKKNKARSRKSRVQDDEPSNHEQDFVVKSMAKLADENELENGEQPGFIIENDKLAGELATESCIQIPMQECMDVLSYNYTSFREQNSGLSTVVLKFLGVQPVDYDPSRIIPKRANKRTADFGTNVINGNGCNAMAAIHIACRVAYPPCDESEFEDDDVIHDKNLDGSVCTDVCERMIVPCFIPEAVTYLSGLIGIVDPTISKEPFEPGKSLCNALGQEEAVNGLATTRWQFRKTCVRYLNILSVTDSPTLSSPVQCEEGYFMCESGVCLDGKWKCDGRNDCGNWEDEVDCACQRSDFRCESGQCISSEIVCDGYVDCFDKSDEKNCSNCAAGLLSCGDGKQCVLASWWCDGDQDCDSGEDERYCSCESQGMFSCKDGIRCLPSHFVCDGEVDCSNGMDEKKCSNTTKRCGPWALSCDDKCLPMSMLCNGVQDCMNGEDENQCGKCEKVSLEACHETAYNVTSLPNFLMHRSQINAAMSPEYVTFSTIVRTRCHPLIRHLGCSILAPPPASSDTPSCIQHFRSSTTPAPRLLPCRELCHAIRSSCQAILQSLSLAWPDFLNCEHLPTQLDAESSSKPCLSLEMLEQGTCALGEFRCRSKNLRTSRNEHCIASSARCDGIRHCADGSDEIDCDCTALNRFSCGRGGQCISKQWVCDQHKDCFDNSDESNCVNCSKNERSCKNYECVEQSKWCDGREDCSDGSDEANCIKLVRKHQLHKFIGPHASYYENDSSDPSGILIGYKMNEWHFICDDSWNSLLSHLACRQLNYRVAVQYKSEPLRRLRSDRDALQVRTRRRYSVRFVQAVFGKTSPRCRSKSAVFITCQPKQCGRQIESDVVSSRILGGRTTRNGSWPWVVSLFLPRLRHVCGGTLISYEWILSAAHCFKGRSTASYWNAKIGFDSSATYNITSIKIHNRFDSRTMDFDIALVRLQQPVSSYSNAMPACLPISKFQPGAFCVIAGWGVTGKSSRGARKLQEGSVHLTTRMSCQRYYPKYTITDRMVCAGHQTVDIDACSGDSGGPLSCWNPVNKQWTLVGITSWGTACVPFGAPGVYTDISYFSNWIRDNMEDLGT